jgi:hypothetical protein
MEAQMHKMLGALLISVLATPTVGFAQTLQFPAGTIRDAVTRTSIRLAAVPPFLSQQQAQQRSWPGRHPVLFGALVGLGVGLVVEAAVIPGKSGGEPHSAYLPMFGGTGAGIGSLTGLIVSVARR